MSRRRQSDLARGLPDALRGAVERTFAATGSSAGETRERAARMLDELVRRGDDARRAGGRARRDVARQSDRARRALAAAIRDVEKRVNPDSKA